MKYKIIVSLVLAFSLSACSDNDLPYYLSNINDAKDKVSECNAEMEKAFLSKNESLFKSVSQNSECNAAKQAIIEYKRNKAKLAKERKQAEYEANVKKYTTELTKIPFSDFYTIGKECLFNRSAKCEAFKKLKDIRTLSEIELMINSNKDEKLDVYSKKICAGIDYNEIQCDLSKKALAKQNKEKIEYYLANRDKLAISFNACQAEYQKLTKEKKYRKAMDVINTYQCRLIRDAASKLRIYDFSKSI